MNQDYYPRIADQLLAECLQRKGAVEIKGAKWCGKTSTAAQMANSFLFMQDPNQSSQYIRMAELMPSRLLEGDSPRLIDEWQDAPQLWDAVRFDVDQNPAPGRFILTGSAVPKEKRPKHSGTGRFAFLTMRTMSLWESRESTGETSLKALFAGGNAEGFSRLDVGDYAFITARGGWPAAVTSGSQKVALGAARDYVDAICNEDISRYDGVRRSPGKTAALLRAYARNISSQAADATLRSDMSSIGESMAQPTLAGYLDALRGIYVTDDLEAWNPRLRSKAAIRTSPTRCFTDPSIAVAALHASPEWLLDDLSTFGLIFESLCVRDLRVYGNALDGCVYHYRDKLGREADAVMVLGDGRWALFEMKMGATRIDEAAQNLLALARDIDTDAMGEPAFLAILCTEHYAYTRPDGVHVIPLGCLKP